MTDTPRKPSENPESSLLSQVQRQFRLAEGEPDPAVADSAFRRIGRNARERSVRRHEQRIEETRQRLEGSHRQLRWVAMVLLLLLLAALFLTRSENLETAPQPQQLATWIEQQKLLEQLRKVQEWLGEGAASSDQQAPQSLEELQAWLDQIKLNPELQSAASGGGGGGGGFVPFQCSRMPIQCEDSDVPSEDGEYRIELSRLVRNANIMLADNGDCEGTVHLVGEYGSLFGWRRSEAQTKARTELSVARCFLDNDNPDKAKLHYNRTFCASASDPTPDQAMNALYGLARIAFGEGAMGLVENHIACSEELLDYHLRATTTVDTLHHYISLALMYYEFLNNTHEAIRLQEKALDRGRELMALAEPEDLHSFHNFMLTVQLNLMEGYITIKDSTKLASLHEEVLLNPLLQDSDYLIARGMLVMQMMIDGDWEAARTHMALIIKRYRTLAEFTTFWSWDAFDRWQAETRNDRNTDVDKAITQLREALSPPLSPEALQLLLQVQTYLNSAG